MPDKFCELPLDVIQLVTGRPHDLENPLNNYSFFQDLESP